MSESRAKKRAHSAVLEACPYWIYCGGEVPAVSIDHVPPRAMFRGRRRPKGLEFASCKNCNDGTGRADLVAALLSSVAPDARDEEEGAEQEASGCEQQCARASGGDPTPRALARGLVHWAPQLSCKPV
jgi:hypothetical protein